MSMKVEPVAREVCVSPVAQRRAAYEEVFLQKDIVYAQAGARSLELDVARPAFGSGPFPLLLVFPGNGWGYFFWFDRRACTKEILEAASRGYVAAAVDYRPAINSGFEAGVEDGHRAVEWLRAHAVELDADPERIALTGFSSGGQLALLTALSETRGPCRRAIKAIVTTAAPADMSAFESNRVIGLAVRGLFGGGSRRLADRYRRASPAINVRFDMPPLLMLHGMDDRFVPVKQSLILDAALRRIGVRHRLVLSPHRGHRDQWRDPLVWSFLAQELETRNRR